MVIRSPNPLDSLESTVRESVESQNTGCKWNVINSSVIILCRNSKQLAKLWGFEADVSLNGQSSLSCAKESKMSATFTIWLPSFCHEEMFWPLWQKCFPTFGKKSPLGGKPNSKRYVKVFPESCMCPWKLEKLMVSINLPISYQMADILLKSQHVSRDFGACDQTLPNCPKECGGIFM